MIEDISLEEAANQPVGVPVKKQEKRDDEFSNQELVYVVKGLMEEVETLKEMGGVPNVARALVVASELSQSIGAYEAIASTIATEAKSNTDQYRRVVKEEQDKQQASIQAAMTAQAKYRDASGMLMDKMSFVEGQIVEAKDSVAVLNNEIGKVGKKMELAYESISEYQRTIENSAGKKFMKEEIQRRVKEVTKNVDKEMVQEIVENTMRTQMETVFMPMIAEMLDKKLGNSEA